MYKSVCVRVYSTLLRDADCTQVWKNKIERELSNTPADNPIRICQYDDSWFPHPVNIQYKIYKDGWILKLLTCAHSQMTIVTTLPPVRPSANQDFRNDTVCYQLLYKSLFPAYVWNKLTIFMLPPPMQSMSVKSALYCKICKHSCVYYCVLVDMQADLSVLLCVRWYASRVVCTIVC